jgi:MFS family permease
MSQAVEPSVKPLEENVTAERIPKWIWVHVAIAALAMTATLPGRTHGLGLITEPLLSDLHLGRVSYGWMNTWATLLGAAFCLPCGWLIDKFGIRLVLTAITASLGGVVVLMSRIEGVNVTISLPWSPEPFTIMIDLFILVLLTRGLGQSALSVASLALIGQAAGRRAGLAVGVYSFLTTIGFIVAFMTIRAAEPIGVRPALGANLIGLVGSPAGDGPMLAATALVAGRSQYWYVDWRSLWAGIGYGVLAFSVFSCVLVRPKISGWPSAGTSAAQDAATASMTLGEALLTPTFWVFSLSISFYGMIVAGISLFNESILAERSFDRSVFMTITAYSPIFGLSANLATGWLATRWSTGRLLGVSMLVLSGAMAAFPYVQTLWQVYAYAFSLAAAGGMITVLFFAIWGPAYGPKHLGKIQSAAQMMTVFASAGGPLLMALCKEMTGDYLLFFYLGGSITALLTLAAWWTRLPSKSSMSAA